MLPDDDDPYTERWLKAATNCQHEADPLSLSFPEEARGDEFLHFVVDVTCKKCGLSGSVRIDPKEIQWE
jgi:hypothetical protein